VTRHIKITDTTVSVGELDAVNRCIRAGHTNVVDITQIFNYFRFFIHRIIVNKLDRQTRLRSPMSDGGECSF
jgi:hypothetical protein